MTDEILTFFKAVSNDALVNCTYHLPHRSSLSDKLNNVLRKGSFGHDHVSGKHPINTNNKFKDFCCFYSTYFWIFKAKQLKTFLKSEK